MTSCMRVASASIVKGLIIICMPRLKVAVAHDGILGVAGDKQDFQARATHPRSIGNLATINAAW